LVDLRNHGDSDHHESMTYKEMAEDVIKLMDKLLINKFTLLGHSMGGKTAMTLATLFPDRLDGLVVVDTAPNDNNKDEKLYSQTMSVIETASKYDIRNKTRNQVINDFTQLFVSI
jgi:pimeloyl-ACP methyl ester carboxylesterase